MGTDRPPSLGGIHPEIRRGAQDDAAQSPELGDGYAAALTNFGFMANDVVTTDEVVATLTETERRPAGPTHRPRA